MPDDTPWTARDAARLYTLLERHEEGEELTAGEWAEALTRRWTAACARAARAGLSEGTRRHTRPTT